ncbi:MAG TPA: LuxR family transcriptional regulator [Phycisphaerales bacterium]|nr:LuxR family transcriptional regulator [Phycisphaerales bacterium]
MQLSSDDNDLERTESLFKQPGAIFDEKQWTFLKQRYRLTSREVQVAILICQGYDNDHIAEILGIQQGTVKTHVRNVYRRIRVKNKISLLLKFLGDINKVQARDQEMENRKTISEVAPEPQVIGTELPKKI